VEAAKKKAALLIALAALNKGEAPEEGDDEDDEDFDPEKPEEEGEDQDMGDSECGEEIVGWDDNENPIMRPRKSEEEAVEAKEVAEEAADKVDELYHQSEDDDLGLTRRKKANSAKSSS
jgi:hypothetical protein